MQHNAFRRILSAFILVLSIIYSGVAFAVVQTRWTDKEDTNAEIEHVLSVLNTRTGSQYVAGDFQLLEATRLATSQFETWVQVAGGVPLKGRNLRIWKSPSTGQTLQVEAFLEEKTDTSLWLAAYQRRGLKPMSLRAGLNSQETMELIRSVVKNHRDDRMIQKADWKDQWQEGEIFRFIRVKGRRGYHNIKVSLSSQQVVESTYEEFPQVDIPVRVFPIYEEAEGGKAPLARIDSVLKNLDEQIPFTQEDPFASLRTKRYFEAKYDPILGRIPQYQEQGYWSPVDLKNRAQNIVAALPKVANSYERGFRLSGKYVTINLHPEAKTKFKGIEFPLLPSAQYRPAWVETVVEGKPEWEMIPGASLLGRPATAVEEFLNRPARRLPDHNTVGYINDGFDEIQVYWAVDTFMAGLGEMGFTDPDISTRPFHAFLYDPDIAYQDNAYYTDDTINFTTYSPNSQNFARDNSTIWHELGHGIMDRLMGDYIILADTGGLSEGMADFLAQLLVQKVMDGQAFEGSDNFRIMNQIGFHLTNEVHDDGEAYGGTMYDLLVNAMAKFGRDGLVKVTDLTLEAMRLSRNHPQLTAQEWFNHMIYADERPSQVRAAGEMRAILVSSLEGRNYRFDEKDPAAFVLKNGEQEVTDRTPGSRGSPIPYTLGANETITHNMKVQLKSTDTYKFVYPVKVRVQLENGPIQGAINWVGQENKVVEYSLNSEAEVLNFDLTARGTCERVNREDGSCVDFAWVQIWNAGETRKPVAKKRFYLRIKTKPDGKKL